MASDAGSSPPLHALEALLDAILDSGSLERTLEAGAHALASALPAEIASLFQFEEGLLVTEVWHPEAAARDPRAAALRAAAHEAMGLPLSAAEASRARPDGLIVLPLHADGATLGAACLIPSGAAVARGPEIERIVRAVACRAGSDIERVRARALKGRYERWFRTLDDQIRVLDRERQKFAAIVHASDAAVFVTDLSHTIRWTNSVMGERTPAGAAAWIGLPCSEACRRYMSDAEAESCADCPVARSMAENAVVHREHRHVEGGEQRSFYLSALPIRSPDGKPDECMVMIQDLSDLEILRTSEARYRLLFERSGKGIIMVDPTTTRIVLANAMASRLTGHQGLSGMTLRELHREVDWPLLEAVYRQAMEEGLLAARECLLQTREGASLPALVTGARTDLDGRPVLMLEFQDLTETHRVQQALHIAQERLRTVIAASPIVLFALDQDGVFTISEGRGLERLGLEPGEIVGRSVFEVYRDYPHLLASIRRALAGEELTDIIEIGGLAFDTNYAPLRGTGGEILGVIGVATDVTERRRLEDQLRQAQRMEAIGRLAGGVAHDFNNLLAAVLGHSELLMGRLELGHPMRKSAEEIQKAASRGAMLTRQLLAFGRKEMLALRVLDLNAVVAGMGAMLKRLIGEDIHIETVPAPRPAPVRADPGQLEQVIMNLAVNARDAMPQGGRLTIEVAHVTLDEAYVQRHARARAGEFVMLSVTDTGCGMEPETLAHAFEPFFTTKERGKGTGLGLATVYAVVEQCEGHVHVYSEPGLGASFKVYLPRAEEGAIVQEPPAPPEPVRGGTETVLLVEDEDAVRSTSRQALEANGYTVLEARNGVEALQVAKAYPREIPLLITDVVMPRMGGGELAQHLVVARPGIRVLFISGYPDDAIVRHGVIEHGSFLLQKPFALADFARKVREVLDAPRREAA